MQFRLPPLFAICLGALLAAAPIASGQTVRAAADLAALQTMTPRPAGSAAEAEAIRYVETRLQALAVPYTVHPVVAPTSGTAVPGAIIVSVPGGSDRTLAVIAPLDHRAEALPGKYGSTAVVTALHLAARATRSPLPLTLWVVFVGADNAAPHGPTPGSAALNSGIASLAAGSALRESAAVIYLNLDTIPGRIVLRTDGLALQTPRWLVDAAVSALDHTGLPFTARSTANQLARIGLPLTRSRADPYLAAGYPAIELAGDHSTGHTTTIDAWIDDFGSFIESLSRRVTTAGGTDWERHYLFVQVGRLRLALDELGVVASIAAALSLALALAFLMPGRLRPYRRLVLRSAWMLPLAATGIYAALSAASALLSALLVVRDLPSLWQRVPALAVAFKGSMALLLVLVAVKALALATCRMMPGTGPATDTEDRRSLEAGALSTGAVALLAATIAAVTTIDPAASLPFVCSFAAALMFCLTRLRAVKIMWLAASVAAPAAAVADLTGAGADALLKALLLSPRTGDVLLTVAILPFVLMTLRLTLRSSEPLAVWGARRRLSPLILAMALASGATGLTLFVYPSG